MLPRFVFNCSYLLLSTLSAILCYVVPRFVLSIELSMVQCLVYIYPSQREAKHVRGIEP